jgi:hypothetical protein
LFGRIFEVDIAVGSKSGRSLRLTLPLSRSARYFAERPGDLLLRPQIFQYPSTGRSIPHACIAFISGTIPSTFITRFRL